MAANREEAAEWFVLLRRGVITHDECKAFDAWRRDPANAAAMEEVRQLWTGLESLRDRQPTIGGVRVSASSMRGIAVQRHMRTVALMSVAASVVLAMIVSLDGAWWTGLDWWSR